MKVKQLINLLEACNLEAEINFKKSKKPMVSISMTAPCKCKQKEITLSIGNLYFKKV